ncbi:MAG TPA: ubiquinol-cytochrome C chaperone family protein [Rhizomicrobium sp.]|nr:ubiquinol-cytochrome C chaperone family protein [Rhizomicrobium sp.]
MLNAWRRRTERRDLAGRICAALTARARAPVFFRSVGVPDTVDGRFDLLVLHAWLVLEKLELAGRRDLAQAVTDRLFADFDEGLRGLGAGDIGMGRRMKKLGSAFYGRMKAYSAASDEAELASAIDRNVFRGTGGNDTARMLALYARLARIHLCRADVASGELDFGPLPND